MKAKYSLWAVALVAAAVMLALVVPAFGASAALSNTTDPESPNVYHIGDTITYKLLVRNESPWNDAVLDVIFTYPDGTVEQLENDRTYGPGESTQYTRTYVVAAQDVGPTANGNGVVSYLTAEGLEWEDGEPVDVIDLTVGRTSRVIQPELSIVKTVDADGDGDFSDSERCYTGSTVTWKIAVSNTGDAPLTGVTVTDSNGREFGPVDLGVGQTQEFAYTSVVDADTSNSASAVAIDDLQNPVGPVDSDADVETVARPEIGIKTYVDFDGDGTFSDDFETNLRGSDAVWKVVVSNDGPGPLYAVEVTDNQGHTYPAFDLAPGESREFLFDDLDMDGDKTLDASAQGLDGFEASVGPVSDDASLSIYDYFDIGISKSASVTTASAGDEVVYTITYKNNSTTSVSDFVITDDFDERYMEVVDAAGGTVADGVITWVFDNISLAPGESGQVEYRLEVSTAMPIGLTDVGNVAVVDFDADQNPENDKDSFTVEVDEPLLPFTPEDEEPTPTVTPVADKTTTATSTAEEFLPFTGGDAALPWVLALGLALAGAYLRSRSRGESA